MPLEFEPSFYSATRPLFNHFGLGGFGSYAGSRRCKDVPIVPLRPCLIMRKKSAQSQTETAHSQLQVCHGHHQQQLASPNNQQIPVMKKKVVFADDRGFALEHIKVMTEPSDCPPRWKDEFVEKVTGTGNSTLIGNNTNAELGKWEPAFSQPASDYLAFRHKLEERCVCLENVLFRETDSIVTGTVKVKNLAFTKEVFVRVSFDRWSSHEDIGCSYVPSGSEGTSVCDLYDTFAFNFGLPAEACRTGCFEFCVWFRCEGHDYWDSNDGNNYKILASPAAHQLNAVSGDIVLCPSARFADAFTAHIDSWTEFASWNHLINDSPYW